MTGSTNNVAPALSTTRQTWLDQRDWERDVFTPEERVCSYCSTVLKLYKTTSGRYVRTLSGLKQIKARQRFCPNAACPGRQWNATTRSFRAQVFTSPTIRQLVLPNKQYGLDVVLEVGRKTYEEYKTGEQVQRALNQAYSLKIGLATIYRYRDLFEALSVGLTYDHHGEIAKRLHEQPAFVVGFDAMQMGGPYKLYRAVDHLSGFCLGALVVHEGEKTQLMHWRHQLFQMFGVPDYLVSDGEPALHLDPETEHDVPHQDCWYHVEQNIWDALLEDWRKQAKEFLQRTRYRARLHNLLQFVASNDPAADPAPVNHLRARITVVMEPPPKGSMFDDPLAVRLYQFREARTVINHWIRALQGRTGHYDVEAARLAHYQGLKGRLPPPERSKYLQHDIFKEDPCIQALLKLKELLDEICKSKTFPKLLHDYKTSYDEFQILRSWVLAALLRRNEVSRWNTREPQTASEARLVQTLRRTTDRTKKELANIPSWYHVWQWRAGEPAMPLEDQASQLLQRIITRWNTKGRYKKGLQQAAEILQRQFDNLLVFFQHAAVPVSNQALETANGRLKQFWRRLTGGQDRPYTLPYHGVSTAMTMNYVRGGKEQSPLELLGFPPETVHYWYRTSEVAQLTQALQHMTEARRPRRFRLQVKRQSLQQVFKDTYTDWVNYGIEQLTQYLDRKGV